MARAETICGVILAAGFSTRMGRDKALLPWPPVAAGTPAVNTFLGAQIDLLQEYSDLVIVVAGKNAVALAPVIYAHAAFMTINPAPERGQFSSIQTGLQEVLTRGRDGAFLVPVDRPPVLPQTMRDLRHAFEESDPSTWAVVPEVQCEGHLVHGHPILIGREMIEAFHRAPSDATARDIEHQHQQHILYVTIDDPRIGANIDIPEDYDRLLRSDLISTETQF